MINEGKNRNNNPGQHQQEQDVQTKTPGRQQETAQQGSGNIDISKIDQQEGNMHHGETGVDFSTPEDGA